MKKVLLILITVLMIGLPAAAYDFGGSADVSGTLSAGEETTISPSVKMTGWTKVPFERGSFSAEAYYKLNGKVYQDATELNNIVDLSLLKVSFALNDSISMNVGRYSFSDVTSSIFATTSDGVNASLNSGLLKIGVYVGYTGLQNGNTSGVGLSADSDSDSVYPLAAKNVLFLANVAAPNFLGGNTFTLEGLGALNMEEGDDAFNSFYGTLSAAGPVTTSVYYSASVTGSFFTKDADNAGVYSSAGITAYLPYKSMSVGVTGSFGSKNFVPVSATGAGAAIKGGVSATIKPLDSLLCLATFDITSDTLNEENSASWTALAKWQALSDVSANLTLNQDIPLSGGKSTFTATAGVTVSF